MSPSPPLGETQPAGSLAEQRPEPTTADVRRAMADRLTIRRLMDSERYDPSPEPRDRYTQHGGRRP